MHFSINFKKINMIIAFYGLSLWGAENQLIMYGNNSSLKKDEVLIFFDKAHEVICIENNDPCFPIDTGFGNEFRFTSVLIENFIKKFENSEEGKYLARSKRIIFSIQTIKDLYETAKIFKESKNIYLVSTDVSELTKITNLYFFNLFLKESFISNDNIFRKGEIHRLHEYCFYTYLLPLLKKEDIVEEHIFLSDILEKNAYAHVIAKDHNLEKSVKIKENFITITINDYPFQVTLQDFPFLKIKNNAFNFEEVLIQKFIDTFQNTEEGLYVRKYNKEIFSYACLVNISTILEKINTKSLLINSTNKNDVLTMIDVYFLTHFLLFQNVLDTDLVPYGDIHCFADIILTHCYLPCLEKKEAKEYTYSYHDIVI